MSSTPCYLWVILTHPIIVVSLVAWPGCNSKAQKVAWLRNNDLLDVDSFDLYSLMLCWLEFLVEAAWVILK